LNLTIETLFWAIARFFVIEVNNDLRIVRQLRVLMRWKTDYIVERETSHGLVLPDEVTVFVNINDPVSNH